MQESNWKDRRSMENKTGGNGYVKPVENKKVINEQTNEHKNIETNKKSGGECIMEKMKPMLEENVLGNLNTMTTTMFIKVVNTLVQNRLKVKGYLGCRIVTGKDNTALFVAGFDNKSCDLITTYGGDKSSEHDNLPEELMNKCKAKQSVNTTKLVKALDDVLFWREFEQDKGPIKVDGGTTLVTVDVDSVLRTALALSDEDLVQIIACTITGKHKGKIKGCIKYFTVKGDSLLDFANEYGINFSNNKKNNKNKNFSGSMETL